MMQCVLQFIGVISVQNAKELGTVYWLVVMGVRNGMRNSLNLRLYVFIEDMTGLKGKLGLCTLGDP